jgi:hypothetical protein
MSRMFSIHTAAVLSTAKMNPVGSFITGAAKASAFHESFHEKRAISVQSFPNPGQAVSGKRQNLACQTSNGYEIGNYELKTPLSFFRTPANPGIARGHSPCGAGKLQAGKIPAGQSFGLHEIAKECSERNMVAKIMAAFNELFENRTELAVVA